ncbi:iron-containing alcohol dehydrogenase [uncultured Paludibaculum sp.]|uniref:iron-containing alcohol dehydrogenase n=1 Tax=uncultured Paludibaculum sp. TaxID=1765020 RepID=UPI002AAA8B54|nr:iron-containing alcohol dehydrogenase [uncultured Paludibaculum sp.]
MFNFEFYNPTKILFGKGQIASIAKEIPADAKVLITYGGGSIHKNGVYEQVMAALDGRAVLEFGGIEPNPEYDTLMGAVELVRREKVDLILAVGGGSVLDGTKFIAAAAPFVGEPWDILTKGAKVESAVPLASILTLPATGSESNTFAVISRRSTGQKLAFGSVHCYPKFAVLDPETTFSLPARQVANGVVDAFVHTLEQYMTFPVHAELNDRFAESILQTLIDVGPKTLAEPENYDLRATFVWSATLALNGLIGSGVPQDWATHMIGHELTALYGIDHARTLATVVPHLFRVQSSGKREKLVQYAERVWGIRTGSDEERCEAAIRKTEEFFELMGLPTRLSQYPGVKPETPALVAKSLETNGAVKLGERQDITPKTVEEILSRSLAA